MISDLPFLPFYFFTFLPLSKEHICNRYRRDDAREVCEETAGHSMTRLPDAHAAEVDSEDIECGVRRALEDTAQTADERVSPIGSHRVDHHPSGSAS